MSNGWYLRYPLVALGSILLISRSKRQQRMNEEDLLIDERVTAAIEQMFLILLVRFTEMSYLYTLVYS